jgi:hypothetical protein
MGVTGAQDLTAVRDVHVQIERERPRPEIQPVGKRQSRQRQVRAVEHGQIPRIRLEKAGSEVTQQQRRKD